MSWTIQRRGATRSLQVRGERLGRSQDPPRHRHRARPRPSSRNTPDAGPADIEVFITTTVGRAWSACNVVELLEAATDVDDQQISWSTCPATRQRRDTARFGLTVQTSGLRLACCRRRLRSARIVWPGEQTKRPASADKTWTRGRIYS